MTITTTKTIAFVSAFFLLGFLFIGVGCEADSSGADQAEAADDFELTGTAEAGADNYAIHCATCHGADGKGDGPGGRALTPSPTDFTTGDIPAGRMYKAVSEGGMAVGKAATMPPFGNSLSEQEMQDIVAYTLEFGE